MHIQVETLVSAPPDMVFKVATDIHRWPDIVEAIDRVIVETPGTVGVGTRFRETRRMFGREATEEMTITEFDPPRRFVLFAENHGARYLAVHTFDPHERGTTLRLIFDAKPVTFLAKVLRPLGMLMSGQMRRQLENDLADVKASAEAAHAAAQ